MTIGDTANHFGLYQGQKVQVKTTKPKEFSVRYDIKTTHTHAGGVRNIYTWIGEEVRKWKGIWADSMSMFFADAMGNKEIE